MSVVLVDTSVWVDMFRRGTSVESVELGRLLREGLVSVNGLVRAEILSGARDDGQYRRLQGWLSPVELLADPPGMWDDVGRARYRLARLGFQASVADLVVAVCASRHRRALFTLDGAFRRIRGVLRLRLYEPRPA